MAKSKKKFYVVWEGNNPGIYKDWTSCQLQIKGYPGAKYKAFKTEEEAKEAYYGSATDHIGTDKKVKKVVSEEARKEIVWDSLSVDAACSGNPGVMEYQGVDTKYGDRIFHQGPFQYGSNNIGEFLALVHGLAYLQKIGDNKRPIYSDSRTAMSWVRRKEVKTTIKRVDSNRKMFEMVNRALKWLKENKFENEIMKWKTDEWGEIPADFGRK